MAMDEIVARLRELLEKATPGPWHHRQAGQYIHGGHEADWIADAPQGKSHSKIIIGRDCLYGGSSDYALIAEALNALPALLTQSDALKAKDARIAELVSELDLQTDALDKATDTMTKLNRAWTTAASALAEARAEVERLKGTLRTIEQGDIPRPVAWHYRADHRPSKYDRCEHQETMRADCGECLADFLRAALDTGDGK